MDSTQYPATSNTQSVPPDTLHSSYIGRPARPAQAAQLSVPTDYGSTLESWHGDSLSGLYGPDEFFPTMLNYDPESLGWPGMELEQWAENVLDNQPAEESGSSQVNAGQGSQDDQPKREGKPRTRNSRACEACRKLRVRCDPGPSSSRSDEDAPCMRCLTSGQECVFVESMRNKDRTKRIAMLQKQYSRLEKTYRMLEKTLSGQSSSRYYPPPPAE
ncbi:hypothetical protein FRC09_007157 [Ceratobasidium sp. 395]|nr:hypothetical protein FRC09_007157 [Ceratobasidium sp. 395]